MVDYKIVAQLISNIRDIDKNMPNEGGFYTLADSDVVSAALSILKECGLEYVKTISSPPAILSPKRLIYASVVGLAGTEDSSSSEETRVGSTPTARTKGLNELY